MANDYRILVIDDDRAMRESLTHLLTKAGFEVASLSRAQNVEAQLLAQNTDVLLCDVRMPGMTGIELQAQLQGTNDIPLVLMTAHGDITMAVEAIHNGAYSFLEKPFDPRRLLKLLENAAQRHRLSQKTARLTERLTELSGLDRIMIGDTDQIIALRTEIVDLAATQPNVMLLGETGTGKELVARALHDLGPRAAEPFIAINCAAIPVLRFEEMVFGIEGQSSGVFAQAEGGTLFIDELGAIPLEAQAKLLRVIETKEFAPLGSATMRQADIRIVSAANDKLQMAVDAGEFREDLFFRLNTIILNLPPLRERLDDVPLLYRHYLGVFAAIYETGIPHQTSDDTAILLAHDWPGNVRELRSLCERHVLAVRRGDVSVRELLLYPANEVSAPETLREAVAAFERELIGKALTSQGGRMDDVADALGIGRRTLNEKIVKLGIEKSTLLES